MDQKEILHKYLRTRRQNLLGKLDGLDEYSIRKPMTPTGTNLLGLVKHVASVELDYFTDVFNRPSGRILPWFSADAEPDADLWTTSGESRQSIIELHHFSAAAAAATINELDLDSPGEVPWWPAERRNVTLHQILVHMCVETAHHLGHADILRELVDGALGQGASDPNVTPRTAAEWAAHRERIEAAAREVSQTGTA